MTQLTKQMVVVEQPTIHEHLQTERVALFNADGSPYVASGSEGSPGSFPDFTGSGSPEGVQTADIGQSYVDSTNGALWFKIFNGDATDTGWTIGVGYIAGGDPGSANIGVGFTDNALQIIGAETSGINLTDLAAFNGTGNALAWVTGGSDGDQSLRLTLGNGDLVTTWAADGSTSFPGSIDVLGSIRGPAAGVVEITDALAYAGTGNALDWVAAGVDGNQVLRLTLGDSGQYEWQWESDGSISFPGPIVGNDQNPGGRIWITDNGALQGTGNGIYWNADNAVDGEQGARIYTGDSGQFGWNFNADGSTAFPGPIVGPAIDTLLLEGVLRGSGAIAYFGDATAWSGSGNGLFWRSAAGVDGDQSLELNLGDSDQFQWEFLADGSTSFPGSIDGSASYLALRARNNGSVFITDVDAYGGTGNGIAYQANGTDGEQTINIELGSTGQYHTRFQADGSTSFPGPLKQSDGTTFEIQGPNANGASVYIGDEDAWTGSGNGIYWNATGVDGEQSVAIYLGPSDEFLWTFAADGSTSFPGPITTPEVNSISGLSLVDDSSNGILIEEDGDGGIFIDGKEATVSVAATSGGNVQVGTLTTHLISFYGGSGVAQAAHPVLLSDVITILTDLGLCAA